MNTHDYAKKLTRIRQHQTNNQTPSAIFGSIGELPQALMTRPPIRIGLWPCNSEENPTVAMALWVAFAHLLERWGDIEVYRLFVRFEDAPEDFVWTMDKSQFDVEDWQLDSLDDNVGIWGTLTKQEEQWQLLVTREDDLTADTADANDADEIELTATHIMDLFNQLPELAHRIAQTFGANRLNDLDQPYMITDRISETPQLITFFDYLVEWETSLLASLWGVEWDDHDIRSDMERLLNAAKAVPEQLVSWLAAKSFAQAMRPGYSLIGEVIADNLDTVIQALDSPRSVQILAQAMNDMGYAQRAYHLLESAITQQATMTTYATLAQIYIHNGLIQPAVATYQNAIAASLTDAPLFRAYGHALTVAYERDIPVERYVLIDENKYGEHLSRWEAVAAYESALVLNPDDIASRYLKLTELSEIAESEQVIWDNFAQLLEHDVRGNLVRDVIEGFYFMQDFTQPIQTIEKLIEQQPERPDLYTNLAALQMMADDHEQASTWLNKAHAIVTTTEDKADIERMLLSARDPQFEQRLGDISGILSAGRALDSDDVDFLENAVENAPHLVATRILLGTAYYLWHEYDDALEVFMDAQEILPDQPIIIDWLARILWHSGEREMAFTYLNRGLAAHPSNVQLLARVGQYLFDSHQLADARAYLGRAEDIDPQNASLNNVKKYIAQKMAENPDQYNS